MTEVDELEVLIRSTATGNGFTTSAAQAKAMNVEMAALGGGFASHGSTIATAERDITKEADGMARALGAAGDSGAKAISRFEALGSTMGSAGVLGVGIGAALVGLTGLIEGVKSAITNADDLERSLRSLGQAYDSQGQALATQGAWINDFLDKNRKYIDNQYAARDAIATLVRAGYGQVEVQRIANDAVDLAAVKHLSYAEAVNVLNLALQGNTRGLRDLGISAKEVSAIMGEATKDNKELAAANKTLAADTTALAKAQEALNLENDRLHAKHTVTAADLDILHGKQKAVTDLTAKVTADQNALADAQGNVATSAGMQSDLLGILEPKLAKARDTTSDLAQAQNNLNKAWQDASGRNGPALGQLAGFGLNVLAGGITGVDTAAHSLANNLAGDYPAHPRSPGGLLPFDPNMPDTPPPDLGLGVGGVAGVHGQRKKEFDDLLPSIQAVNLANEAAGRSADRLNDNLDREGDGLDHLATRNAVVRNSLYESEVAQNSLSTRVSESLGKWRDESDAMDRFKYHGTDALTQTQVVFDTLVAHVRSEKLDVKLTVDTAAAQAKVDDFLESVRERRANIPIGGSVDNVSWNT